MNADPIEEIRATLTHLRQNPATKKRFPSETWDAISTLDNGIRIGLFFTGRRHAGENLDALLDDRPQEHPPPIQQCDALSRTIPKNHETYLSHCLAHARRMF